MQLCHLQNSLHILPENTIRQLTSLSTGEQHCIPRLTFLCFIFLLLLIKTVAPTPYISTKELGPCNAYNPDTQAVSDVHLNEHPTWEGTALPLSLACLALEGEGNSLSTNTQAVSSGNSSNRERCLTWEAKEGKAMLEHHIKAFT